MYPVFFLAFLIFVENLFSLARRWIVFFEGYKVIRKGLSPDSGYAPFLFILILVPNPVFL
jgi:hypothetical protein